MIKQLLLLIVFFLLSGSFFYAQTDTTFVGAPGTGPGGSNPDYATLKEACDHLNIKNWEPGISAEYIIITSNITEPAGIYLEAGNRVPGSVILSFLPLEGKSPIITFTEAGDTASTEYGWYINSYEVDIAGLTIQSDNKSTKNIIPLKIQSTKDDSEQDFGIYVRESKIYYKSQTQNADPSVPCWAIIIEGYKWGLTGNVINACFNGVSDYSGAVLADGGGGIALNTIEARKIGIEYNSSANASIYGNNIVLNQEKTSTELYGIKTGNILNLSIESNNIIMSKNQYSVALSMFGIYAEKAALITNNMISGFYRCTRADDPSAEIVGIKTVQNDSYIAFNSIRMNNLPGKHSGSAPLYAGIDLGSEFTGFVRNNIIVNEEDEVISYCLYSRAQTINSHYNAFSLKGNNSRLAKQNDKDYLKLADWKSSTGQDTSSVTGNIYFADLTDLHLTGASVGDNMLSGNPLIDQGIALDIDGQQRDFEFPYMGADEADIPLTGYIKKVNHIYTVGNPGSLPGGGDPDFFKLSDANKFLNDYEWNEEIDYIDSVLITSDLKEAAGAYLGSSNTFSGKSVRLFFAPYPGREPVITFTEAPDTLLTNYGWRMLIPHADFITIENLVFESDPNSSKNIILFKYDDEHTPKKLIISDCKFLYKCKTENIDSTILCTALDVASFDLVINRCYISTDFPGTSPYSTGMKIWNRYRANIDSNMVEAKKTGVFWDGGEFSTFSRNTVIINQDKVNTHVTGIEMQNSLFGYVAFNKVLMSKNENSFCSGATGINLSSYYPTATNNMISDFHLNDENLDDASSVSGIILYSFQGWATYNSILMNDLNVTNSSVHYSGIRSLTPNSIVNNLIINRENEIPSYCLFTNDTLTYSDYNDLNTNGSMAFTGYYNNTAIKTLSEWQQVTEADSNSVNVDVQFVSLTDLHLTGSSVGDNNLGGKINLKPDMDIDGDIRPILEPPYMGADEASIPLAARVIASVNKNIPTNYDLMQNYPNPFNPVTKIVFNLPGDSHVKLEVIGITGEIIKILLDEYKTAGSYTTYFTADNLASGTYIYRLTAGKEVVSRKMMLLK